ncbi:MAG: OmpA family protein [Pyrinomonadaceae bacterium]|nr:OmpA family protein [Pyrinomonadaceae bacterium]
MIARILGVILVCGTMLVGCVTKGTHEATLTDLDKAQKALTKIAAEFDAYKEQATGQIAELEADKTKLSNDLLSAQTVSANTQGDLVRTTANLNQALATQKKNEEDLRALQAKANDLEQRLQAEKATVTRLQRGEEALAAEKERLEKERAAKEAEIERLTRTQQELSKSLQAEIERGDITIKQVRDRLTINMVEKVLFNSGQAQVKPAGLKVLTQVSDVLKNVTDKQIRIEGHTDNVPIGVKLREKFPTNWELSTGRATNVVRFFIDRGGVNRERLEAVGFADTRPVASNDTDEGRTDNRRIEILLYPRDLSQVVGEVKP